jgi:hypothetical protein
MVMLLLSGMFQGFSISSPLLIYYNMALSSCQPFFR